MKQEFEKQLVKFLKENLSTNLAAMVIAGHSTDARPLPFICVDCSEMKPYGIVDGMLELTVNISIADSAHDIDPAEQAMRRFNVEQALLGVQDFDDIRVYLFEQTDNLDAKSGDESKLGDSLAYTAIVQAI